MRFSTAQILVMVFFLRLDLKVIPISINLGTTAMHGLLDRNSIEIRILSNHDFKMMHFLKIAYLKAMQCLKILNSLSSQISQILSLMA